MNATPDELTKPLGVEGGGAWAAFRPSSAVLLGAAGLAALTLVLAGTAGLLTRRPPAPPEPYAVVPITVRDTPPVPSAPAAAFREATPAPDTGRSAGEVEQASGVSVHRPPGEPAPGSILIRVPDASGKLAPAPDPRLVERTRFGPLPRIGPDGARPAQVYGRPAPAKPGPRIAVVLGGLGIGQSATADAIAKLPPGVTLAFAPYGSDLERTVARARDDGHEVMLQVPMEPFDYPDNDPGPHTLTARAKPQENIDRLHWVMGRFTGYTGVMTFMGAKLTADEAALAPILKEIAGRGLIVVDDGSSSRSTLKPGAGALRAAAVLDAVPRADAIDRELAKLEDLARERGSAVASASALPLTVDRIARWSKTLEERGVQLVSASALAEARR